MKKVLIVSRNFPPLLGGMEQLNLHLAEEISRRCVTRLIAPEGAEKYIPDEIRLTRIPAKPLSRFLVKAAWCALREARAFRPDVILAGSGLMAPMVLAAARICDARAVAYAHGLDLTVPHPVYRAIWRPALRRLDAVIVNSRATSGLAEAIGIVPDRVTIIHPGVSLPEPDPDARLRFRRTHDLGDGPILLSVGRLAARKGLREFVAEVLPLVVARYPDLRLVVIGDAPSDALYAATQSVDSIIAAAQAAGVERCLRFLGRRFGTEFSDAYAGADLYVFPVRAIPNDPEGFGMVAVEAAAHGLPTVAYATGGVVDAVREGVSGYLAPAGDAQAFAGLVCRALEQTLPKTGIRRFAEQFAWPRFGEKIQAFLETL
ncbi:MAG: glycosyltransferase family 4 protein [Zoogloeaceae bacterium]|nr:glycosyltransferase family 4 protein [Zoogloeaceae bacterium]